MELKDGIKTFSGTRKEWRSWLGNHHLTEKSVWLVIYKKDSQVPSVTYSEAVDEALCFGWVDSKPNKRDDKSYYQFFSKRNPKSNWSKINKDKVADLSQQGLMAPAGLEMVKIAKQNGTWDALNDVENLIVPKDMQLLFDQNKIAFDYWTDFPKSVKRGILEWILNAKRPETREKRIKETIELAEKNIRANQYRQ